MLYKTFIKFIFTKQHVHHIKVDSRLNKQRGTLLRGSEATFHSERSNMRREEPGEIKQTDVYVSLLRLKSGSVKTGAK